MLTVHALDVTVTVKLQLSLLPEASVAIHFTEVLPIGNVEPEAGAQLTVMVPGQLSLTVGAGYVTTAPLGDVADTVMFGGHVMTGGVLSMTVTVNEQVEVLFELSVAVYVTVVVPLGNVAPGL